jgi:uncharacterized membrane protein YbhN (UPF0104 family)
MGLEALASTLRNADWSLVAVAVAAQLVPLTLVRSLRWRALLPQEPRASVLTLSRLTLASQAVSNVLPLRPGEVYRAIALQRRGFAIGRAIAAQAAEKVVDASSLAVFALFGLSVPGVFHDTTRVVAIALVLVVACVLCLVVLRGPGAGESAFARAVESLRSPSAWGRAFMCAFVADSIDISIIALSALAVGMPLTLARCAMVLVLVNIAIVIPAAPGQIGTLEAGAVGALVAMGQSPKTALAFALLYHAVHVIPATLLGGVFLAVSSRPTGGARNARCNTDAGTP